MCQDYIWYNLYGNGEILFFEMNSAGARREAGHPATVDWRSVPFGARRAVFGVVAVCDRSAAAHPENAEARAARGA